MVHDRIAIIDLGSRENTEIARQLRQMGYFTEIHPHDLDQEALAHISGLKGLILNGGPNRAVPGTEIEASKAIYESGLPILSVDHQGAPKWPQNRERRGQILSRFAQACGCQADWTLEAYKDELIQELREQIGEERVLLALSGGVDSSVVAALLHAAIGEQLLSVHVNHGFLRQGESEQVLDVFRNHLGAQLVYVDASERFLDAVAGVSEPEQKRRIIGETFIRVFEDEAKKHEGIHYLAQGTIYPDIIESGTRTSAGVKAHHNVGGLPEKMGFSLVEPLRMLFKDEVRELGLALGLPHDMVYRQPFPGPGLAVRCTGAITRERLEALRASDAILREEIALAGLDEQIWQYFTVVPDFRSVGVREGQRCYEWPCIIRAVNTVDAMTAEVAILPADLMSRLCSRITAEVPGINRVLYDWTPKPCGTIEWE